MIQSLSILGSTGSVGRQSVAAAQRLGIPVSALTTNRNISLLEQQARRLHPQLAVAFDEAAARDLAIALADTPVRVASGIEGLCEAAVLADCVVTAVSGSVGLKPTLCALDARRRIALANKETLVCAGTLVMARAAETGAEIVPVDSEHSAIFQCIGSHRAHLRRILLTGSGGPFRGWTRAMTESVTPEMAVRHPNWNMGAKISVDSATMMNKGLEFIEAMHLFSVSPDEIEVVIHPESVIHSMVEFEDGAVLAQLGVPDMSLPIQYAMTWPERAPDAAEALDFFSLGSLSFYRPDPESTPCLALAMQCARRGGSAPAILSAANEEAVALFLAGEIGFNRICDSVADALNRIDILESPSLEEILACDAEARVRVREYFGR